MGIVKRWTGPARGAGRRPEGENAPASRRLRLQLKALSVAMALLGARTPLVWEAHAQAGFFDVPGGAWYAELLEEAAATGRVRGYEDGSFRPDRELSFGEFLAMMTGQRTAEYSGGFEHWATGHYAYAAGQGWISEGRFPARKLPSGITRREMALIAAAAAESAGLAPDPLPRYIYTDMDSSDSAERAVSLCTALGILNGYEDGSFRPDGALRRCEALKVVMSWEKALERAAAVQVPDQGPLSGVVYGGAAEADPQAGTPGQGGAGGESAGASALGRDALGALAEAARSVRCERDGSRFSVSFEPPAAAPGSGLEFSLRFLLYGSEEEGRDQLLWYEYGKDTPDWAASSGRRMAG